jgi:hypothetical protein
MTRVFLPALIACIIGSPLSGDPKEEVLPADAEYREAALKFNAVTLAVC